MAKRRSQDAPRLGFRPKKSIKKTGTDVHVGNLPRGMTGEDLQKKLTGLVGGPVAVSKKRRHVWARVTVRDNEEARAAVEQAVADVESKYPVRVSTWAH